MAGIRYGVLNLQEVVGSVPMASSSNGGFSSEEATPAIFPFQSCPLQMAIPPTRHINSGYFSFTLLYTVHYYHNCTMCNVACGFQAITHQLDDPLISQGVTRLDEDRTVIKCETGQTLSDKTIEDMHLPPAPLVPLGRHGTECETWLRMQLHDIDSGVRRRSG